MQVRDHIFKTFLQRKNPPSVKTADQQKTTKPNDADLTEHVERKQTEEPGKKIFEERERKQIKELSDE